MKTIAVLLISFVLIACSKKYDLKSVLEEYDNPKSEYAFIFTSSTIGPEIANFNEMLPNYKQGDPMYSLISSHINRLNNWNAMYLDSVACLAHSAWKPDPCPCPLIMDCLFKAGTINWFSHNNHGKFKCTVNDTLIKVASDVFMPEYRLRFIKLQSKLNLKPGDKIQMIIPISYFSNDKLVNDSLVINAKY